jgi:hypothetical protein
VNNSVNILPLPAQQPQYTAAHLTLHPNTS